MSRWIQKKIGNTLTAFIDGDRSNRYPSRSEFTNEGAIFLNAESIKTGRINTSTVNHISFDKFNSIKKGRVNVNDILMTTRGNGIGDVAIVDIKLRALVNAQMLILRTFPSEIYPLYLYYFLKTKFCKEQIGIFSSGSAQPQIPIRDLKHLPLILPPLPIQRKIAAILSAYDELIENNNRRIAILEKMVEEIYREWFVRLRFPGHEKVKVVKGVPEGWEVKKVGEIIQCYIGGGWGEEIQNISHPTGAYVIRGTDIPELKAGKFDFPPFRYHKYSNFTSRAMRPGDIVFEVSGGSKDQLLGRSLLITEGIYSFCKGKVICASFCKMIRPSTSSYFLNYFLQALYECGAVGTYQIQSTGISNYQFESFVKYQTIILPTSDLLEKFDKVIFSIASEKDNLAKKNNFLTSSRDLLLPRLISGKLDVENLDIDFPQGMEEMERHG